MSFLGPRILESPTPSTTDINTRIGWYSKGVTTDTNQGGAAGFESADPDDASWQGMALSFPR